VEEDKQKKTLVDRFVEMRQNNVAQRPKLMGQLGAMWREALKDVRNTMNEVFFGKSEHMGEMGTPLNPTPHMVTKELGKAGPVDSPKIQSQKIEGPKVEAATKEASTVTAPTVEAPQTSQPAVEPTRPSATTQENPKVNEAEAPQVEPPAQGTPEAFDQMMAEHAATVQPAQEQTQEMER